MIFLPVLNIVSCRFSPRDSVNCCWNRLRSFLYKDGLLAALFLCWVLPNSANGSEWVEVEVGNDSGDTHLWPYFYTATRFVDINSIKKKDGFIFYSELIDSSEPISPNVKSLIVNKKSLCNGKTVVWRRFAIFRTPMGQGKPIMKLNPNETESISIGSAGFLSDNFVCNLVRKSVK